MHIPKVNGAKERGGKDLQVVMVLYEKLHVNGNAIQRQPFWLKGDENASCQIVAYGILMIFSMADP